MSQQWGGQPPPSFQYPMQTGISFQQPMQAQQTGYPVLMQQQRPPQLGGLQPQPTGFPAQYQQPQVTGFQRPPMGQMQFQQVGTVPPVPQLPPNLAGQNRFLSPSPGIPSQATGYPGAGGGSNFLTAQPTMSPLVSQMTGFMDPRLAMMGSTFMPSASGAFPAGAGASGPQFGGASLQQSIAQHNETQRGSSTVPIPWALSKQERKQYDQIFRAWDPTASGFLDGKKALEVFGASGLDQNNLAKIWMLADSFDRGKLNREEFHVAMGLIYRALNGNTIPDDLPPELVPPSEKNLDESVDMLRDILKNETYNRATNGGELSQSKRKDRSLYGNDAHDPRKDGTVYKYHDDEDVPVYRSKLRTIDRQAVRTGKETATEDIAELQRQLENANKQLGDFSAEQAKRTAEDDELDRRLHELKRRAKRVQDDIDYVSQAPRSFSKDEERRKLERELLNLLHEDLPEVQRKIEERERRRKQDKDTWAIERNRRNYTSGRYGGRDDDYGREDYDRHERNRERREDRGYLRGTYDRDDRDRDRDRDRDQDRDRDRDRDRNQDRDRDRDDRDRYGSRRDYSRDRDRDRDRERYERDRPRSPSRDRTPPPPPIVPASKESRAPPPAPSPAPVAKPALKNMTREEREAFIRGEAQKRLQVQMAKLGLVSPSSSSGSPTQLDSAVEDRLAKEKAEAEEKARQAEKETEERERARKARLASERGAVEEKSASPAPSMPARTPVVAPATPTPLAPAPTPTPAIKRGPAPPPPMSRKKPAPPPPASRSSSIRSPAPPPAPPAPIPPTPVAAPAAPAPPPPKVVDPEEEALKAREEELRKRREAQKARMLALEKEEEEARLEQERFEGRRRALHEQKSVIASPPRPPPPPVIVTSPPVSVPPPPPPPPAEVTTPSSTNPFRLGQGAAATPVSGGPNPFFRPAQPPAPPAVVQNSPTPPSTPLPAPQRQAEALAPSKPSIYNKSSLPPDSDNESGWGEEKEEDEDSSDDDRTARQKLAQHLFGTVMPARPASAGSGGAVQSAPRTPQTVNMGLPPVPAIVAPVPTPAAAPPPPPPPPVPPAPPSVYLPPPAATSAAAPPDDRSALLTSIMGGARLKPTKTIDKSRVQGAGAVLGSSEPPVHISVASRSASPPAPAQPITPPPAANGHAYKESVDWYAGLATEVSQYAAAPTLPPLGEEPVINAPVINVSSEDADPVPIEEDHDPLDDVDLGTIHRVRSLYKYEGSRGVDLAFTENLVLLAHPSKSGGPWWYGSISGSGAKGFFPSSYVQILDDIKAAAMYPYAAGNPDELSFEEGDVLAIVDRSEPDWWKAEKDGKIYVVPAAYLELVNG